MWIIDAGHGCDTPGKRYFSSLQIREQYLLEVLKYEYGIDMSAGVVPNESLHHLVTPHYFREFAFNRLVAMSILDYANASGIHAIPLSTKILTGEFDAHDIPVADRVSIIKNITENNHEYECVLLSVHSNAADSEKANGVTVWTTKGSTPSDTVAQCFINSSDEYLQNIFKIDTNAIHESNFHILKRIPNRAVLTETGFFTNNNDRNMLSKKRVRLLVAAAHFNAMLTYQRFYEKTGI